MAAGNSINSIDTGTSAVNALLYSGAEMEFIVGLNDGYVQSFSLNGTQTYSYKAHTLAINFLKFNKQKSSILTGAKDGKAKVLAYPSLSEITIFNGHPSSANCGVINTEAAYCITGGNDERVIAWGLNSGSYLRDFEMHTANITAIEANSDFSICASGDAVGKIHLFNPADMNGISNYSLNTSAVKDIIFIDKNSFIAAFADGEIYLVNDLTKTVELLNSVAEGLEKMVIHPTFKYILYSSATNIYGYDLENKLEIISFKNQLGNLKSISISEDGSFGLSGDDQGVVDIFEIVDTSVLYFKSDDGLVYNSHGENFKLPLDFGRVNIGDLSPIKKLITVNGSTTSYTGLGISASLEASGVDLLFSETKDPFQSLQELNFNSTFGPDSEYQFYIRFSLNDTTAVGGGSCSIAVDGKY